MGLSNFGHKKAGAGKLELDCQIFEAGKLEVAPENLHF